MAEEDKRRPLTGLPTRDANSGVGARTFALPPLSEDQASYLRDIKASSEGYDRNILMGGPRNKLAL
jgi:hypothetical protein